MMTRITYQTERLKSMVKKSDIVRGLVADKQYKKALQIAKDFRLGIPPEQSLKMKKAYECMVHERFYLSLGENIQERIADGIETIVSIYGRENNIHAKALHKQV